MIALLSAACTLAGLVAHVAIAIALFVWARRSFQASRGLFLGVLVSTGLGVIAAPIGLLVTIAGLVSSFGAVAHADAAERSGLLSDGISQAMMGTVVGLVLTALAYGVALALCVVGAMRARELTAAPRP